MNKIITLTKKQVINTDGLNLVLMGVALLLSIAFPFKTFIFSLAVLGPLHYFTEINWLDKKKYFANHNRAFRRFAFAATFIYMLPIILKSEPIKSGLSHLFSTNLLSQVHIYTNGLIMGVIGLSIGFVLSKKRYHGILLMIILGSTVFFLWTSELYLTWTAVLLPTIVHVYVFTGFFMLYGALKSGSKLGLINVLLLALVPLIISHLNLDSNYYHFNDTIKETFLENNFHILNAKLSGLLGASEGNTFFFYEILDIKIQSFIAFAYSYHYLNWFSKTTVINWHKEINFKKSALIGTMWIAILVLFYLNFRVGFLFASFFSILHVFLELPLNVTSIKGVISEMFSTK